MAQTCTIVSNLVRQKDTYRLRENYNNTYTLIIIPIYESYYVRAVHLVNVILATE